MEDSLLRLFSHHIGRLTRRTTSIVLIPSAQHMVSSHLAWQKLGSATTTTTNGVNWFVGLGCRFIFDAARATAVELSNDGNCQCASTVALRPDIGIPQWGAVDSSACLRYTEARRRSL